MDDDSENIIPSSEDSKQQGVIDRANDIKKVSDIAKTADKASKVITGSSGIGIAVTILVSIVVIFLFIGIIVSLIYLPGSIGELVKGFFKNLGGYFFGENAMLNDDDFSKVANIIQNRGYDLYAEGYINDKLNPSTDLDEDGNVKKLPTQKNKEFPHLIDLYTRMDAYTYRVRNVAGVSGLFSKQDMRGFLNFSVGTWEDSRLVSENDFKQGFFREAIKVDREQGILNIKKNMFWGGTYSFKMDGWSGRYGLPLDLFVALHQGTRAPDLVREIAKGTKAYTNKDYTEESIEFFDQSSSEDTLHYIKPILNILLLKTKIKTTVNFLVPETTTVNGSVYVLNKDIKVGEIYNSNPYSGLRESDFTIKSQLTNAETFKAFFKTENGQFVQIRPKNESNSSLSYGSGNYYRNSNGTPIFNLIEIIEETTSDDEIVDRYKVIMGSYDFSSLYFTKEGEAYKVKDQRGTIVTKDGFTSSQKFVDTYGLYNVVTDISSVNSSVNDLSTFHNKLQELYNEVGASDTYIPMIKNSENHWFRDVYFFLDEGEDYVVEDKDYYLLTGESWSKYDITEEEGKKILTPQTKKTEVGSWSAYEVRESANRDSLGEALVTDEDSFEGFSKYVFVHEDQTVTASQKQEGRRGMTNARTKNLFANVKWYKYDGSTERADKNNEDRVKPKGDQDPSLKSLVEPDTDLIAAFEILEGSNSLDSQYILRDLKELYVELGYFEKEDLRDPVRRILRWPLREYNTPKLWPSSEIHQDPEGYGVFVPSKATLEEIYDEKTIEDNKIVVGEGFEEDTDVLSPVTGKIEEIGTKDIERLITDKNGNLKRIIYKDVGYITISAIDATAPVEASPYKEFYENEYIGVISGKEKHGKQEEDSRYIKGNKITIEGIKVEIPADVNNKENSSYIKQIKSSYLRKVQDKETRYEAEAIEQKKIDAPNYISISGSEAHIGDYIKEGTVIGKTTKSDLRIIMRDVDKAFIENVNEYIVLNPGFYIEIMEDYYTKAELGEPNIVDDVDLLRDILEGFPILQEHAQELLDMQEKYEVNALFAAAVAIIESSGGNAKNGLNYDIGQQYGGEYNNIFSIQGSYGGGIVYDTGIGNVSWDVYDSYKTAFEQFAELIQGQIYWGNHRYFVSEIAELYCDDKWGVDVNNQITNFLEKAKIKLYGTSGDGTYIWPTRGYTNISSQFGWRIHPVDGVTSYHGGIDIPAEYGTPIVAIDSGTVVTAVYNSSYGNYVLVNHGNGISSLYAHMSSMAVSSGQTVNQGDILGYVGSTGVSTGSHLHLEIRINGSKVDPMGYLYY